MGVELQVATAGRVKMDLYTLLGRKVSTLADEQAQPGAFSYSWCGRNADGQWVATGAYLLRVEAPNQKKNLKVLVVK